MQIEDVTKKITERLANLDFSGRIKEPEIANTLTSEQKHSKVLNFKDFKGLKKVKNLKERNKIGRVLGEGSFGQVRIGLHRKANLKCAIKIIRKDKIDSN